MSAATVILDADGFHMACPDCGCRSETFYGRWRARQAAVLHVCRGEDAAYEHNRSD